MMVLTLSVLITGGFGFIGLNTVQRLLKEDFYITILDINGDFKQLASNLNIDSTNKINIIHCDVVDYECLKRKVTDIEAIIHLAAIVNVVEVNQKPNLAFNVNVRGTHNILLLCLNKDIEKIIFASSAAVYGNPRVIPISEDHPLDPINLYGLTKVLGENIIKWYSKIYGLKYVIFRYFNVYGPLMTISEYSNVILSFLIRITQKQSLQIYGDGKQTRDFVFVKDVADANYRALISNKVGIYNVGTGKEISILDLAKLILKLTHANLKINFEQKREGDIRRSVADIKKIKKELNWSPKYDLERGLIETINWFFSQRNYPNS